MTTASVVTYHHGMPEIAPLLRSLLASPLDIIYIIDHSGTGSPLESELQQFLSSMTTNAHSRIEYMFHQNNGYGGGHNVALRKAMERGSRYHLVVNPDVWFESDVIPFLISYMDEHPNTGHVMPKILYPNGSVQKLTKLLPTPLDLMGRFFLPGRLIKRRNDRFELKSSGYNRRLNVPFLSGCFMFLRTEALKEIGLFDERYFMYVEDVDLTRRIHARYKTTYLPEKCVYHKYERASRHSLKLFASHVASTVRYFNKWGWIKDEERDRYNNEILKEIETEQVHHSSL